MKVILTSVLLLLLADSTAWAQSEQEDQAEQAGAEQAGAEQAEPEPERGVRRLGDVMSQDVDGFSMSIPVIEMPQAPLTEQPQVSLPDQEMDDRLQNILTRRAFVPDNAEIEQELTDLLDQVEAQARAAMLAGDGALADRLVNVIAAFDEQRPIIAELAAIREAQARVAQLLEQAGQALEAGMLIEPEDESARALFQQVLTIDGQNSGAQAGLEQVEAALLAQIDLELDDAGFESAESLLARAEEIGIDASEIDARRQRIESERESRKRSLIASAREMIDEGQYERAERQINQLIALGADSEQVAGLRNSLDDAVRYGGFEPGQIFQDGIGIGDLYGPVMVVMPTGTFAMGSPDDEDDRVSNEGPRTRVTFERGFAMAQHEVTVGQFRAFVEASAYLTDAERNGSSRIYMATSGRVDERSGVTWRDNFEGEPADDSLPVIHVSWNDADAYAKWLATRTGRDYRLPSEQEFEYALRAGSQTRYWWGDRGPSDPTENVTGDLDQYTDQRRWNVAFRRYGDGFWGPAPVGSLQANPFGLYDMGGNVMEWVLDCWHDSYARAPTDGSAWVNPGCDRRVIRGASWSSAPSMSRSAFRLSSRADSTDARVGFRLARDL